MAWNSVPVPVSVLSVVNYLPNCLNQGGAYANRYHSTMSCGTKMTVSDRIGGYGENGDGTDLLVISLKRCYFARSQAK